MFIRLALAILLAASTSAAFAEIGDWASYEKAGDESFAIGDFASAETKFRSAIDQCSDKSELAKLQVKYTNAMMSQGKFKESEKELKKCVSLAKSALGTDSITYAESLDLQAWMSQGKGKMNDAIDTLKSSIVIFEAKAPDSSDLADAYEHMGLLCETVGLLDQSTDNYSKALEIRKKLLGAQSIEVADLQEKLAHVAQQRGNVEGARQLYMDALRVKESRGEAWKPFAPEPTDRVVKFSYYAGAPNCQQGSSDGLSIQKITGNGISVEAAISQKPSDFAKTTRALVRIHNDSQYDVDVLPKPASFIQITPSIQILPLINAVELANRIQKKGESKAKWIKFWGADAMTQVTSISDVQGRGMPPVYGYVPGSFGWSNFGPAGYGYGYTNGSYNYGRNKYSASSFSSTMVPDYQAREEAYRKAAEATSKSQADAAAVRDGALGTTRVQSGGSIQGSLDFEYSKYESGILRIPIGNAVFEFRFQ